MTRKLNYTLEDTACKMADSLIEWADGDSTYALNALKGLTIDNFNVLLDDTFDDGGETRTERFTDLAWDYSLQFGKLESKGMEDAQWKCITRAIQIVQHRLKH